VSLPLSAALKNSSAAPQQQPQSLHLIKSLVALLHVNDASTLLGKELMSSSLKYQQGIMSNGMKRGPSHFIEQESQIKYLSQMWSLVLKSLTVVEVNELIEAKIFDSLVTAFLKSTEEIKQITYPQILSITEIIAAANHAQGQ
jgi:hypothetical protein